ncbi:TolC family protein [Thauera sp. Sel9]|uniref:TolC family protein n=1 Tax=Thauera sp. Sel9 TaxID=2974299 RepID=UPI0021E1A1D3|nr:TolC family protein [Thauera sp. Sel9]MCV2219119.1 TolC family protein [Thauera sp. Sel9]
MNRLRKPAFTRVLAGLRAGAAACLAVTALVLPGAALSADTGAGNEAGLGAEPRGLIDYAREHSPAYAADRAEVEAAQARIEAAGALPDPRFELELMDFTNTMNGRSASLLPERVGETRYRIVQPLPAWGKRELDVKAAEARARQAGAVRDAGWSERVAAIEAAWLRYYAADRELGLARDALALMQELETLALARYRLGLLPQQAVLRAQREITEQRLLLLARERARSGAVAALNGLLSRRPDAPLVAPAEPGPLPDLRDAADRFERARSLNPAVMAAAEGVGLAHTERDRTRRDRLPDFGIGLTHNRPDEGRSSWDLMFEVTIPLQQGSRRAREYEAERMLAAAEARRDAAADEAAGRLGAAWASYTGGRDGLRLLRDSLVPQAAATRDAARSALAGGQVDFDSVLEAERQLIAVREQVLQAEVEARLALSEIERLSGEIK